MKYKHILLWVALLLITACASMEPARVENGIYINPSCGFSLRVPAGWKISDTFPAAIKNNTSFASRQNFQTAFSDLDNKRFILVLAEKTEADWVSFKMYSDKFIASLEDFFAKEKSKFLQKPASIYYHYEVHQDQIKNCNNDCIATKINFQYSDLKCLGHNIIYQSDNGMLYTATLVLICREDQYVGSLKMFHAVVESFRRL